MPVLHNGILAREGDSGGPVYYGNVAYGIVQSKILNSLGGYDFIYTPTDFVQSGIDVTILTSCC